MELVGESIDDGSTDAKTSEGTWAGKVGDRFEVLPGLVMFGKFVTDESVEIFSEVTTKRLAVFVIVEF